MKVTGSGFLVTGKMTNNNIQEETVNVTIDETKQEISDALRESLKEQGISIRKFAIELGMQHPQVLRITGKENYTINNLIKILDAAGLKITVEQK